MNAHALQFPEASFGTRLVSVAVVTETYPPEINGVAITVRRMVEGLLSRGHRIQLIRPRQGSDDTVSVRAGLREVLVSGVSIPRYSTLRMGLPSKAILRRLWKENRPDVVHVATEGPLGWSAVTAASELGIPVGTDFHTNFHCYSTHYGIGWMKPWISAYLRRFHNRAQCTLVPTEAMRRNLLALGCRNVQVIARGVDTGLFNPSRRSAVLRRSWGVSDTGLAVIHVGRLAAEKNLGVLFDAFEGVRLVQPGSRLILVGDGPERARLRAPHPEQIYAGMQIGEDLGAHYASGDLFLFPSLTETFGSVTLEAMSSGLAVVAFGYAAAGEYIRQGRNGFLVPVDDPGGFTAVAMEAARSRLRLAEIGKRARSTAEQLSWERILDSIEDALRDLAEARHRGVMHV